MQAAFAERIAKDLNISVSTVRRVLTGSHPVSDEKRNAILSYIDKISSLEKEAAQFSCDIVAVIPSLPGYFWANAINGAKDAAARFPELSIKFLRISRYYDEVEALWMLKLIKNSTCRAAVAVSVNTPTVCSTLTDLSASCPIFLFNARVEFEGCAGYFFGDIAAEAEKAAQLVSEIPENEKRVLCLNEANSENSHLRQKAFRSFLESTQCATIVSELYNDCNLNATTPSLLARLLYSTKEPFNIVYVTDGFTYNVCSALRKINKLHQIYVVGHELDERTMALFDTGVKGACVSQNVYLQAYNAVCAAACRLLNRPATVESGPHFTFRRFNY